MEYPKPGKMVETLERLGGVLNRPGFFGGSVV
jgi:hypothetical protein